MKKKFIKKNNEKEYMKKYYKEHKKGHQKYMKKYYKDNSEEIKLNNKIYHNAKVVHKDFNKSQKNSMRNKLVELMSNYSVKKVLTLESEQWLFANLIPEKKIYVFEKDKKVIAEMKKNKPKNVSLFEGDIAGFVDLEIEADCVWLDFCSAYMTNKETIYTLKDVINKSKIFAVTFCCRRHECNFGDMPIDVIRKIQEITQSNHKVLYGRSYKDDGGSPMLTIIFEGEGK